MSTEAKITIETFKTVTKAIAQSDDLDIMTNHLSQLLVAALDIKACAIYVLDLETKELEILASFGLTPKYLSKGPILADKSIGANLKGEPVIVPDVSKDDSIQYP
ncbi:MAG: GAF domain-containing protein, partial [Deltaproteobacteria bacterium]|nr:GAF domain-containing protein [Deltaproteobacteria bacterium]